MKTNELAKAYFRKALKEIKEVNALLDQAYLRHLKRAGKKAA